MFDSHPTLPYIGAVPLTLKVAGIKHTAWSKYLEGDRRDRETLQEIVTAVGRAQGGIRRDLWRLVCLVLLDSGGCAEQRLHGIDMLAIGKESVPVRIAELTAGAEAILFACQKVVLEKKPILLGLPLKCQPTF